MWITKSPEETLSVNCQIINVHEWKLVVSYSSFIVSYPDTHDIIHKLVWNSLPHIFEDAFFRTVLSAEFPLLNTILQIAESDGGPLVLEIHLDIFTQLIYNHFPKTNLLLARRKTGSVVCGVWLRKREWRRVRERQILITILKKRFWPLLFLCQMAINLWPVISYAISVWIQSCVTVFT